MDCPAQSAMSDSGAGYSTLLLTLFAGRPLWPQLSPYQIMFKVAVSCELPNTDNLPRPAKAICKACFEDVAHRPLVSEVQKGLLLAYNCLLSRQFFYHCQEHHVLHPSFAEFPSCRSASVSNFQLLASYVHLTLIFLPRALCKFPHCMIILILSRSKWILCQTCSASIRSSLKGI